MAFISPADLFKAIKPVDLRQCAKENKTIMIKGHECDPTYLMYLVEYLTGGIKYDEWRESQNKK